MVVAIAAPIGPIPGTKTIFIKMLAIAPTTEPFAKYSDFFNAANILPAYPESAGNRRAGHCHYPPPEGGGF